MAMRQQTFASQSTFEKYGRKSRRELFLDEREAVVPWFELQALVEPNYPKAGNGRRPVGLAIMLRTYFMQQWFNLSDPGVEEAFYESAHAAAVRLASTWAWLRRQMKRPCCASATCSKSMTLAARYGSNVGGQRLGRT